MHNEAFSVDPHIARNLAVASALAFDVNTGFSMMRGSPMSVARNMCGSPQRTKRGVLQDYVAWLEQWFRQNHPDKPPYVPNPSVRRALEG